MHCEAFRDAPATKTYGAFQGMSHTRTGETPYTQRLAFRRGNCDSLAGRSLGSRPKTGVPAWSSASMELITVGTGSPAAFFRRIVRWFRLDGHECCLNNEQHYYEKERSQFISPTGQTPPTQV